MSNQKLIQARKQRHWTQEQASEKIGVSVGTYRRWEAGTQLPHPSTLALVCEAFNMSDYDLGFPEELFLLDVESNKQTSPTCVVPEQNTSFILLTQEEAGWLVNALGLGDNLMESFDLSKREALRYILGSKGNATRQKPVVSQLQLTSPTSFNALSRRQVLAGMVGSAALSMGLGQAGSSPYLHPEEALLVCASNVPLCWQLYFEGGLQETHEILPSYLSQLVNLAQYPSNYQQKAAVLASQAYQLSALLEILYHNLGLALNHAKQALEYANVTDDQHLQTAAYIRLAVVYSNLKRPVQRLQAYEQATQYSESTSPLLRARVYAGLMETHSAMGNEKGALQFLERTQAVVPTEYERDPNFSYTHFDAWSILMYEKDMYLNLGRVQDAWSTLERSHLSVEKGVTPNRVDLTIKQAETSFLLGNLDSSVQYLSQAATGSNILGSQLLLEDTHDLYLRIKKAHPQEKRVLELEGAFIR